MPTLQMRKLRLREWQSLAQATELELGSSKAKLIPLTGLATSGWRWLSQELVSFLWVLIDVGWFGTNPMSTRREWSRVHKMEYGTAAKGLRKRSCLNTKRCPRQNEWKNQTNAGTATNGSRREECRNTQTHLLKMLNKISLEGQDTTNWYKQGLCRKSAGGLEGAFTTGCAEFPNVIGLSFQKSN